MTDVYIIIYIFIYLYIYLFKRTMAEIQVTLWCRMKDFFWINNLFWPSFRLFSQQSLSRWNNYKKAKNKWSNTESL